MSIEGPAIRSTVPPPRPAGRAVSRTEMPVSEARTPAAPAAPAAALAEAGRAAERVHAAVTELNKFMASAQRELAFSMDERSGRPIVRVIDPSNGQVLRQIPSEEALRLAERLQAGESIKSLGLEAWS